MTGMLARVATGVGAEAAFLCEPHVTDCLSGTFRLDT